MKAKATAAKERPIVQTVKLDQALFVRLKVFGAKTRRSNQDILHTALIEYLNKMKV
jgi:predicted transcriptional regulator